MSPLLRKVLATPNDFTLTVARIVLAAIFFGHGTQKMFGFFGGPGFDGAIRIFQDTMGIPAPLTVLAMTTEVLASIGLIVGLLSRVAASGVMVVMIVAPFANHLYPRFFMNWNNVNPGEGYEYHLLAIALILGVLIRGGGALSLDRAIAAKAEPIPTSRHSAQETAA
jgi:putative oxidoreductase